MVYKECHQGKCKGNDMVLYMVESTKQDNKLAIKKSWGGVMEKMQRECQGNWKLDQLMSINRQNILNICFHHRNWMA